MEKKATPMMQQFLDIKKQHSDCILLFRAGDFYETFYDDAKTASKVLNITLTSRGGVDMAGVPHHSITPYIKKLIQNNFKVALCEQLEDPKQAKGIVKRGVTRIITPGTILEDDFLENFENNYIMSVYLPKSIDEKIGISLVDISTGEFLVSEIINFDDLRSAVKKFQPREVVINENSYLKKKFINFLNNQNIYFNFLSDLRYNEVYSNEIISKQFGGKNSDTENENDNNDIINVSKFAKISIGALFFYIYKLQKFDLKHINNAKELKLNNNLILDEVSLRNLEIVENLFLKDNKKTLFGILNNTKTPMGARLFKNSLIMPLLDIKKINERFDAVEELNVNSLEMSEVRNVLDNITDIERVTSRISSEVVTPGDFIALKKSLAKTGELNVILKNLKAGLFSKTVVDTFDELVGLIDRAIVSEAPNHTRDIGYIKKDFDDELKKLYDISDNSKDIILEIEDTERLKTGINSLKIKFNRIFGYYIEIPKSQDREMPEYYVRKQTLVNAERFTIPELKEKEDLILNSEERIKNLEKNLYHGVILRAKEYINLLQETAKKIALIDLVANNAYNAEVYNYYRPSFVDDFTKFSIVDGRNPIVERFVDEFISNSVVFSSDDMVKIITGPNLSGKSTFLRQLGLISIMAQSGGFVPAKNCSLCIVDRIFTRIGAHDEISEGKSTFMVEMSETANILQNATKDSLVLLDEIGRGTSTYDGVAIAWAVTEFLIEKNVKTVFATHYHYLNKLEEFYSNTKNYHTKVKEEGGEVEFLRKIERGGTDKSYGIYVGKLAGLPDGVINRAEEIQKNIENKESIKVSSNVVKPRKKSIDSRDSSKKLDGYF